MSRQHPPEATDHVQGVVTGEPGARERARRVREGGAGKGPSGTSPASYLTITNDWAVTDDQVVGQARGRCNQENLIAQLKGQVRALHAPVNTLVANWAYMAMAALAWSIKAWCALLLPVSPSWAAKHDEQRRQLLRMDFRTFLAAFVEIPCQVIKGARQVRWRVLAWNPLLGAFFRLLDAL